MYTLCNVETFSDLSTSCRVITWLSPEEMKYDRVTLTPASLRGLRFKIRFKILSVSKTLIDRAASHLKRSSHTEDFLDL